MTSSEKTILLLCAHHAGARRSSKLDPAPAWSVVSAGDLEEVRRQIHIGH